LELKFTGFVRIELFPVGEIVGERESAGNRCYY